MPRNFFKSRLAILSTLMFVVVVIMVHGWRSTPPDPMLRPQACTLAPGIHLLGRLAPAVAYVVETRDGLVLIDSGLDPDCVSLREQMRELHLELRRLRAILLTHAHADHSLGARLLKRLTGATIYAGRGDAEALRRGMPREAFTSFFYIPQIAIHATDVDVELKGNEVFEIGDARFKALAAPGHSPGSICYLLEKDGLRSLFAGDVILSLSRTASFGGPETSLGTKATYHSPRYRADAVDFLATLERLRELPPPDLVLPGHPHLDATPQSARLPVSKWQSHIADGILEMRTLLERYRADGKHYLDGNAHEILPGLHYFGDIRNTPVYCLLTDAAEFLFDAPGGPGLAAFVEAGLRRARRDKPVALTVLLTSCDAWATAGLKDLSDAIPCTVVVPRNGKKLLPALGTHGRVVDREDMPAGSRLFPGKVMPLSGPGQLPAAYYFAIQEKTVLVTGRTLMRGTEMEGNDLKRIIAQKISDPLECLESLDVLRLFRPNVWLPATPQFGSSAFLYDDEWTEVLSSNEVFLRSMIKATRRVIR